MEAVGLYSFFLPAKTPKLMEESQYFGNEACSAFCGHKESGNTKLMNCKVENAGFLQGGFWWEADTAH